MKRYNILLLSTLLISCTSHTENDLIDTPNLDNIKYSTNIKPIMDNYCISCHGSTPQYGATTSLTTAIEVKNAIINNQLIERISKLETETNFMPLGGTRLTQSTINNVITWKNNNYIE